MIRYYSHTQIANTVRTKCLNIKVVDELTQETISTNYISCMNQLEIKEFLDI